MTTRIPVGGALCSATFTLAGSTRPQVFTMGVKPGALLSAAAINAVWLTALTSANTKPAHPSKYNSDMTFKSTHVLWNDAGALRSDDHTVGVAGSGALFAAPTPQVASIVSKKTAGAGPAFRGRMYLPSGFQVESGIDDTGIINSTSLATQQTSWTAFLAEMSANLAPCVLLGPSGGMPNVTSLVCQPLVGTIRRRLRK